MDAKKPEARQRALEARDRFFEFMKNHDQHDFVKALDYLRHIDAFALARDVLEKFSRQYLTGAKDAADELGATLPNYGHLVLHSEHDVALSLSVRLPITMSLKSLTTSWRHEFHRVLSGEVMVIECAAIEESGERTFAPVPSYRLGAGQELLRLAGTHAYTIIPLEPTVMLSVSAWQIGDFVENVDRETGRMLGTSFAVSEHSILSNVLEICSRFRFQGLADDLAPLLDHSNHRLRLSAIKALIASGEMDARSALDRLSKDEHSLLYSIAAKAVMA